VADLKFPNDPRMQALFEQCEERSHQAAAQTERDKLDQIERRMTEGPSPVQERIAKLANEHVRAAKAELEANRLERERRRAIEQLIDETEDLMINGAPPPPPPPMEPLEKVREGEDGPFKLDRPIPSRESEKIRKFMLVMGREPDDTELRTLREAQ
jgi:hypothetical protein